jgi:hypothetical protein
MGAKTLNFAKDRYTTGRVPTTGDHFARAHTHPGALHRIAGGPREKSGVGRKMGPSP